jgi:GAF domain-containing protein
MSNPTNRPEYHETLRYAIFGALFGATFPLVGTVARLFLTQLSVSLSNMLQAQRDDPLLWVVDTAPIVIGLFAAYSGYKQDLLASVNEELNLREIELKNNQSSLERRVVDRTAQLAQANDYNERRAKQFEAIAQVSRVINQTQNLQDILPQITQVISQQFNYYHVGVFLLNAQKEYAILSAANSEGGQRMLDRHHKLRAGQVGIVGYVAESAKPRIALDTGADAVYFNNPDLPETRSEMALPLLHTDGQLIGVLDIQSVEPNAFNLENIEILTILADQVAVAISNARLYEETQKNLLESEILYRRDLQSGWKKFTRANKIAGVRRAGVQARVYTEALELPGADEVRESGRAYVNFDTESQVTMPVKLRGEMVGMLNIKSDSERKWSADEMDIVTAIVERAALAIENARLLAESRKATEKERIVSEISAKVSSYTNRDNILQAAVTEIGRTLPGAEVILQLQNNHKNDAESR